jgi:hypothetical protein
LVYHPRLYWCITHADDLQSLAIARFRYCVTRARGL